MKKFPESYDEDVENIPFEKINEELTSKDYVNVMYKTNNRYAYYKDIYEETKDSRYKKLMEEERKVINFVPTYDNWCLTCNKRNVNLRCSKCKVIFFCDKDCQKEAWKIHKKHCGRDLFCACAYCGKLLNKNNSLKCSQCPVRFCSNHCYRTLTNSHIEFDCDKFKQLFD